MVGHDATELLVGAQSKTERTPGVTRKCVVTHHAIAAPSELPAGAGCQEKPNLPAKGNVFLLDIPSPETRHEGKSRGYRLTPILAVVPVPVCVIAEF